jgi:hypothetical protein
MLVNYSILRWFIIFLTSIVASGFIQNKGLFSALWVADLSGISFVILGIYAILTVFIGVLTYRLTTTESDSEIYQNNIVYLNSCWYASELLMALGMIGTLVGFTLMLGPALAGLDPANIVASKAAIFKMAAGMSTAVLTTLVGLITSQLVKIQLINIETTIANNTKETE